MKIFQGANEQVLDRPTLLVDGGSTEVFLSMFRTPSWYIIDACIWPWESRSRTVAETVTKRSEAIRPYR